MNRKCSSKWVAVLLAAAMVVSLFSAGAAVLAAGEEIVIPVSIRLDQPVGGIQLQLSCTEGVTFQKLETDLGLTPVMNAEKGLVTVYTNSNTIGAAGETLDLGDLVFTYDGTAGESVTLVEVKLNTIVSNTEIQEEIVKVEQTITFKPSEGDAFRVGETEEEKPGEEDVEEGAGGTHGTVSGGSGTASTGYIDVASDAWYAEAVRYVSENGLMDGVGGGRFDPNATVTRAMVWTVLARMDGVNTAGGSTWYEKARTWAMETGVSDGTDPMGAITREQLAAMLYRYDGSPAVSGTLNAYPDAAQVSDWAKDALVWATQVGLINGINGQLSPKTGATRAQLATMLMRLAEL